MDKYFLTQGGIDTALRLVRYFNTTPQFWVNLQISYDLKMAKGQLCLMAVSKKIIIFSKKFGTTLETLRQVQIKGTF